MMLQKCFAYTQETTYSGIAKAMYGNGFEVFVNKSTMTINKVTSGGFDVPMSSTGSNAPEVTGTNKGSYRVYRSEKKVNGGTLSIVVS